MAYALYRNTSGFSNTGIGFKALENNTYSNYNVAVGNEALQLNTGGTKNVAVGVGAGSNITDGSNNTCIGHDAYTSYQVVNNEFVLGNGNVQVLRCAKTGITALSDKRDKTNITELESSLDFINELKPVTFNWDKREWYDTGVSDGSKIDNKLVSGFIAQDLKEAQEKYDMQYLNLVYESNPEKLEATTGNLLPIIVKSIQELTTMIKILQQEQK